jgi:hypothetical protein
VGVAPSALAVDEQSGRALVVNAGGPVQGRGAWSWLPGSLQQWLPPLVRPPAQTRTDPASVSVLAPGR